MEIDKLHASGEDELREQELMDSKECVMSATHLQLEKLSGLPMEAIEEHGDVIVSHLFRKFERFG